MKRNIQNDHRVESAIKKIEALRARSKEIPFKDTEKIQKEFDRLSVDLNGMRAEREALRAKFNQQKVSFLSAQRTLQRYEEIFNLVPDGYLLVDRRMKIVDANQSLAAMLKVSQGHIIGESLLEYVAGEFHKILRSNLLKLKKKEDNSLCFELEIRPSGEDENVRIEVFATIHHDSAGVFDNYFLLFHDIADRRLVEQSFRELANQWQITFDATSDAICLLNKDYLIIRSNLSMQTMFRKSAMELFGVRYTTILYAGDEDSPVHATPRRETMEVYVDGKCLDVIVNPVLDDNGMLLAAILVLRDVSDRKRVETELIEAKILLEKTFASLDQAVFVVGTNSRTILACNPAVERIFGYTEKELIGQSTEFMYVDRLDYEKYPQEMIKILEALGVYHAEMNMRRKDGGIFPVEITETGLLDGAGNRIGVVSVIRDITERKRIEEALLASESKFRSLVVQSPYGILVVDEQGNIVEWNAGQEQISGLPRSDVLGRPVWDVQYQIMPDVLRLNFNHQIMTDATTDILRHGSGPDLNKPMETEIQLPNGTRRNIEVVMYSYKTSNGYQLGSITRDITERKLADIRMEYLATHDELTDLPNRYLYRDRLRFAIERSRRVRNHRPVNGEVLIAVTLLDLDNFKFINDSYGHDEGDRVLKIVAERLNDSVRKTDTIARMGGDEFVLIHENLASIEDVIQVARKILMNLSEPVRVASFEHQITASIGISLYPMDGEDDVTLLKQADIAMYRAKRTRNNFEFYRLPEI